MRSTLDAVALLRASGTNWDARSVLARHGLANVSPAWSAGAIDDSPEAGESGFNVVVAKAYSRMELVDQTHTWLQQHGALVADIAAAGARGRFNIWLHETPSESEGEAAPSLKPADLKMLADAGIEVRVVRSAENL